MPDHQPPAPHGKRRLLIGLVVIIGAVLIILGAVLAVRSWFVTVRQAQAVDASATALTGVVNSRQWSQLAPAVDQAQADAAELNSSTHALSWRVLGMVPFIGASAGATADLAASLDEVLSAARPLVPKAQQVINWQVQGDDGSLDLSSLQGAAPDLRRLGASLADAAARLEQIDTDALLGPLASPVIRFRDLAASSSGPAAAAAELATWGPSMLGADGARTWLVLLENPAEARGGGGFPGGYVTVRARDGRLSVQRTGTSTQLNSVPIPDASAPADARELWQQRLRGWNTVNQTPHFPTVARLATAGMAARGEPVSGVITVNPRVLAAILQVVGPVSADGETITAQNAEQFFTVDVYAKYRDRAQRDRVTMALVDAVIARLLSTRLDPVSLVNALREPVANGDVQVWSADPKEEAWLAGTSVGGVIPDTPGSVVAVALNNSAGSKTDAFMQTGIDYTQGVCPAGTPQSSVTVAIRNDAPANLPRNTGVYDRYDVRGAPAGSTSTVAYIYAPVGATYLSSTIDGKPATVYLGQERGRPVWYAYLPVNRGQTRTLRVQFLEPSVPEVEPRVITQAMVNDPQVVVTSRDACA
ncbi:MAG: DUF4012 domain-containing protein [Candidatus Nanopelagicales bacterium]|nr:DUF4012 domain-containing protein [Candidatus Nanopelagicales bacterium]